ncbi:septin-9-like [Oncorhynchus mykiss]|uniref:septin-9-like n=1 Tax=Oncorhynchus mykiss TaxID=8022 RepID=UPI001877ED97|nr:septin-9-like [Oncorhynchus mykiss]XP_036805390.1 septin-9-like [Oncorhynchus mykiss]
MTRWINEKIREMIPFAVVGSNQYLVNGNIILGTNKVGSHRRTHMQNIKDITSSIHYEVYRVRRLNETNAQPSAQPSAQPNAQLKTRNMFS